MPFSLSRERIHCLNQWKRKYKLIFFRAWKWEELFDGASLLTVVVLIQQSVRTANGSDLTAVLLDRPAWTWQCWASYWVNRSQGRVGDPCCPLLYPRECCLCPNFRCWIRHCTFHTSIFSGTGSSPNGRIYFWIKIGFSELRSVLSIKSNVLDTVNLDIHAVSIRWADPCEGKTH